MRPRTVAIRVLVAVGLFVLAGLFGLGRLAAHAFAPPSHHQLVINAASAVCNQHAVNNGYDFYSVDPSTIRHKQDDALGEHYMVTCTWEKGSTVNGAQVYTDHGADGVGFVVSK